jgi:hypothetical protein
MGEVNEHVGICFLDQCDKGQWGSHSPLFQPDSNSTTLLLFPIHFLAVDATLPS